MKRIIFLLIIMSLILASCHFKRKRRNDNVGAIKIAVIKPEESDKYSLLESGLKVLLIDQNVEISFYSGSKNAVFQVDALKSALNSRPDILVIEGDELNLLVKKISEKKKLPFIISTAITDTLMIQKSLSNRGIIISSIPKNDFYADFVEHIKQVIPDIRKFGLLTKSSYQENIRSCEKIQEALKNGNMTSGKILYNNELELTKGLSYLLQNKFESVILIGVDNKTAKEVASFFHQKGIPTFSTEYQQVNTGGPAFGLDVDYFQIGELTGKAVVQSIKTISSNPKPVIRPEKAVFFINSDAVLYQLKLQLADSIYEQSSVN